MDDPNLDPSVHAKALAGLARLNKLSRGSEPIWAEVSKIAARNKLSNLTLLDIASGGGDILLDLAQRARASGLNLRITGSDFSSTAVGLAKSRFEQESNSMDFITLDALRDPFPGRFDIVTTSLFTHHLDSQQVILLLEKMHQAASKCVIVSDLDRSLLNLIMVWIATRIATRSEVVHYDGPVSVKAAYTANEFLKLAQQAGLDNARVRPSFPCRFLLSLYKDGVG